MAQDRTLKITVAVLLVLLLVGGGCVCLGSAWFVSFASEDQDEEIANTREGVNFGASHTTDECIREDYRRSTQCGVVAAVCLNGVTDFLKACLDHTAAADMSVCDGAPAEPGFMLDEAYAEHVANRYGWDRFEDEGVGDVVIGGLEEWCAVNR